jgi:Ca2+-binding RTX toxin-like protein
MDTQRLNKDKTNLNAAKSKVGERRLPRVTQLFAQMTKAFKVPSQDADKLRFDDYILEQLEPRLLLSADPLATLVAEANVTLQVVENSANEQMIQLIDNNASGSVIGERKLSDIAADSIITITGSNGADKLTVDKSFLDLGERQFIIQFDGAGGTDTVSVGHDVTQSSWQVSGDNSGSMGTNGIVEFQHIEKLTATQSAESQHVLSAINTSFNWQITQAGSGTLSNLELVAGSVLSVTSDISVSFSGFDELGGSGTDYLDYSLYGKGASVDLDAETAEGFSSVTGINTLVGSGYADQFTGDSNNNVFVVDMGDTVNGNGGFDALIYREMGTSGRDLQITRDNPGRDFTFQAGQWDGVTFTADVGQVITAVDVDLLSAVGGSGDNYFDFSAADISVHLDGGAGSDILLGGTQDDILIGGLGADRLTGGAGNDEVIEVRAANFTLIADKLRIGTDAEDTLTEIENVYLKALSADGEIVGKTLDARGAGNFNITLEGTELDDVLYASAHGDTLIGLGGADTITGGAGSDTLSETFAGRATIQQSGVDYWLDLSQGMSETWVFNLPTATTGIGYIVTIDDALGSHLTDTIAWDATGRDVSRAIEKALGLNYGQLVVAKSGNQWQIAFSGLYSGQIMATNLAADAGVTVSIVQQGQTVNDTLIGFSADDIISIVGSDGADSVDLTEFAGNAIITTLAGSDVIKGAQGLNIIDGGDGSDIIYVKAGHLDQVIGGGGDDLLVADLSGDVGTAYDFDLDNDQLLINGFAITLAGFESANLFGADLDDTFDTSGFYGVSASTDLSSINGWSNLSGSTLRVTLDDGSDTIVDIDLQSASTLDELLALINHADERLTGALHAVFNQQTASIDLTGLSRLDVAGADLSLLDVLGLTPGAVNGSLATGLSMSLLASMQLTSQKGNAGRDTYIGSMGADFFTIDHDDISVTAGLGYDTIASTTTVTHTAITLNTNDLTWSGVGQVDASVTLVGVEAAELVGTAGATVLDAAASSLHLVLDAATTNASLLGGYGSNEFRIDVAGRTDAVTQTVGVTINDTAVNNDVVFYGGSEIFTVDDFHWASISGDNFAFVTESSGNLTISNAVSLIGQSIEFRAMHGAITIAENITTDDGSGIAGDMSFYAKDIVVNDGVRLTANGSSLANSGDITLSAKDSRKELHGQAFYNYDQVSASITIGDALLQGQDISIKAFAESNPDSPVHGGGDLIDINFFDVDNIKEELQKQSVIFGYARSEVDTTITISENAVVQGDNITVQARTIARVTTEPLAKGIAVAIGSIKSTADVVVNGSLLAQGDIVINGRIENYLKVTAQPISALKQVSASVAVGILESTNTVLVAETANIVAGGLLDVEAGTYDFSYVGALSDAGSDGKLAAGVAVHIEHGDTTATLAGNVLVKGNVSVAATQKQGSVDGKSGTAAEATVNRVPNMVDSYKDLYKQKASQTKLAGVVPFAKTALTPGNRLAPTKFTAGVAVVYADDTNNANSYIGIDGESSDIQVGGTLDQRASVDSRLLTNVSSTSSSPSQLEQVLGSAGTSGTFKQVPFGGAVSVTIADLTNNAKAYLLGNTQIDVLNTLLVDATAENLTGIISSDTQFKYVKPTLIATDKLDTDYVIKQGDLIYFDASDYTWLQASESEQPDFKQFDTINKYLGNGTIDHFGAVYKYLGDDSSDMRFARADFSDVSQWELLGDKFTSIPSQLLGGDSDFYLFDNTIKSTAAGAKVSLALNFSLFNSTQDADAQIQGNVQINQRTNLNNAFDTGLDAPAYLAASEVLGTVLTVGNRTVSLNSDSVNKSVDRVGNTTSTSSALGSKYSKAKGASDSLNGVGASVYINNVTTRSHSIIEDGATIYADALSVKSDSSIFALNLGTASGSGKGTLGIAGLYMGNNLDSSSIAQVESGVTAQIGTRLVGTNSAERLTVVADNRVDLITIAGALSSGGAIGAGASAIVNDVTKVTKALIGSDGSAVNRSGSIAVAGNARVDANSDGVIIGTAISSAKATGKVTPSGQAEPPVENSSYGISLSGAFIFNTLNSTTSASLLNFNQFSASQLSLTATERSGVYAFPIAFAKSSAQKFSLAAAGIGLRNDATFNISAGASGITTFQLDELVVSAINASTVVTTSVAAGISGLAETSVGTSSSIALAGNVSINNVNANVDAFLIDIDSLIVAGKNSAGYAVDIEAKDESEIYAVALGVAYAGNAAVGVTYSENNINSNIDALISNSDLIVQTGKIRQQANSEADIVSVALGAAVTKETSPDFDSKIGISVAAAVSMNMVRMNTRSKIDNNSIITLPTRNLADARLDVIAHNDTNITGVVVAASVGIQSGATNSISFTGAGASAVNEIYGDTQALIDGSTINQTATLADKSSAAIGTFVKADATGDIDAVVVAASIAYASGGAGTGMSGAIGVALAENDIGADPDNQAKANSITALINNSGINIAGAVEASAISNQHISSNVVGASVAIAKSTAGSAGALSGVGASTTNNVVVDVVSGVTANLANKTLAADSLAITAKDESIISSTVVGASVAGSFSSTAAAGALSIAVSLAENNVTANVSAMADGVLLGTDTRGIGAVSVFSQSKSTITATSVAASVAASFSTTGSMSISGAGANALNTIQGTTSAYIGASSVYSQSTVDVHAENMSTSEATVAAVSVAAAGGAGGGAGLSIGAAVAENNIGTDLAHVLVNAAIKNSAVDAESDVTVSANAQMTIEAGVGAGSLAIAGGSGGGAAGAGSGVRTTNEIYATVNSFIDNSVTPSKQLKASSLTLTASSTSSITAEAGAAAIAAGFGASGGLSGAIGVALARNTVDSDTNAFITHANAVKMGTGTVSLEATTDNTITATSVAASLAVAGGAGGGAAISGAGADANNIVRGKTSTYIQSSSLAEVGAVDLSAQNISKITATVAAVSVSGAGGAGGGVGVSIGAAVSHNDIGTSTDRLSVLSYINNSSINASGALRLNALADMTIEAGVGAGGMAVAGGAGGGIAAAGSGVSTTNTIYGLVSSYIDNSGTGSDTIKASSVAIVSNSTSRITATIGSASLGVAGGAGGGAAITVGISLANNTIDIDNSAYLNGVSDLNSSGVLSLSATTHNDILATAVAATSSIAGGAAGGISISGAGASASNDIVGETQAYVADTQVNSAASVTIRASDTSVIEATVAAVAVAGAGGAGGGIGVALGAAFAYNNIGTSSKRQAVRSYVNNSGITVIGGLKLVATGDMTIKSGVGAGSAAVTGGAAGGISGAGAGVNTTNTVYNEISSYIDNSAASGRVFKAGSVTLTSDSTSKITATAGAAALAAGFGAGGAISGSIGVALARNTIDSNTLSYVTNVSHLDGGAISLTANAANTIKATSVAASVAVSVGAAGGISLSGAGAEASNAVYGETKAYIANSTLGSLANRVGLVDVTAKNVSNINATVAAVSAAGAGGAGGGVGVSIGASVSNNDIGSASDRLTVKSYLYNTNLYASGALTLSSTAQMIVNAGVGAGSAAVAAGAVGVSASGAGVGVTNKIYADVDSYIASSANVDAAGITVKSYSNSDIDATAGAASLSASFAPIGFTVSIAASKISNYVSVNVDSDVSDSTLVSRGNFTVLAEAVDDVYTTGVATSVALGIGFAGAGVIVDSRVDGNVNAGITDSRVTVYGNGSVKSLAHSKQSTESYGIAAGLVASGVVLADLKSHINSTVDFNGVTYHGYGLQLSAYGTENNYVNAVAGSGGVLAGAGVGASTLSTSYTLVNISDTTEITLGVLGGTGILDIKAEHVARFDANILAASGGLLSGSGAAVDHVITADVKVNLGDHNSSDNLLINASDINVDAINRAVKDQGGEINAIAAGLASAAGADSRTIIDFETLIDVANHAQLNATSSNDNNGIALNALNDLNIQDRVVLNASGALAGTGASVRITDNQLLAKVRIGQSANVTSSGDIQISARGTGDLSGSIESDSSGAISVTSTMVDVTITPDNEVLFDNNATVTAYGNMNISTGTDTNFNRDDYKLRSIIDSFAGSVIPIDDATSIATLAQTNTITINSSAHLKTARQINLHAERFGFADMDAQTKTVNWASALGGTADLGGEVNTSALGSVLNYGTLETGIRRNQSIEFNSLNDDGSVNSFTATDGVTFDDDVVALNSSLFDDLENAEEQLNIFNDGKTTDNDIEAFYKSEITRLHKLLLAKGLLEEVKPGVFVQNKIFTPTITVKDIYAEAGRVDVRSDSFSNYGTLTTPSDATVSILNHTTASLAIGKITIPQENGGTYLNGEALDVGSVFTPSITIINDVDLDLARAELAVRFPGSSETLVWPSITINGDITNRSGSFILKSLSGTQAPGGTAVIGKGDINIQADIDVKTQQVVTKGTLVVSLPPGSTYSVDGSEYAKWNAAIGNNGLGQASTTIIDNEVNRAIAGPSIYADNISIDAEYININGKIQSGKERFTLVIDAAMEDTIAGLRDSGASGLIRLDAGNEDFSVFFDANNDQIVIGDMRVSGGYIKLEGHILNTNSNSEIELLGGYAEIDVTNETSLAIKILGLDASQRGEGTLIIRDKAQGTSENPLETIYKKDENGVRIIKGNSVEVGSDNMTYTPKEGWRYSWAMGQESFERLYTTKGTSSWLGIDAFAADPATVSFSGVPEKIGTPTLRGEGAYFEYVPESMTDSYLYDSSHVVLSDEVSLVSKWTTSTWYGKKTYYSKFVKESKVRDVSIHSVKADYGISINFTGKEVGAVSVTSNHGGDVIVQGNISNTNGTTTITTNADITNVSSSSIGGKTIILTASAIGGVPSVNVDGSYDATVSAVRTNLTNVSGASLQARTYGGLINIVETDGPLMVSDITSASNSGLSLDTGGAVYLTAVGGIEAANGTSGVVRGGLINIMSEAHVGTLTAALNIDGGVLNKDYVAISAINDVFISEVDGDLRLKSIQSEAGNVTVNVGHGSLIDANTTAIRDERTYAELSTGLWESLGLIGGSAAAQQKIDNVIEAYTSAREREYSEYWNMRNGMFAGNYSATDTPTLASTEEAYYRTVFEAQGAKDGLSGAALTTYVDDGIQTLNNKRSAEYHSLHQIYGLQAFEQDYHYTVTDAKRAELTGSVHTWAESDLLNLISGSLLKPITNTQATTEDANIDAAGSITITSAKDMGTANGSVEIDLDGNYTADERVQLAAAERNDVYFLLDVRSPNVLVTVNDSVGGDEIVRSAGSWINDGFVAGMQIRIAGSSANANDEGSIYEIASVSANTLTLTSTDLTVEVNVNIDIAAISSSPGLTTLINTNNQQWSDIGLVQQGFIETGGLFYQIQRISGQIIDVEAVSSALATSASVIATSHYRTAALTKVIIDQREDIDILALGTVDVTAVRNLYLGSEETVNIAQASGDHVRIKSKQSLTDQSVVVPAVTARSSLILEAGNGAIGSAANRFTIDTGSTALFTARAKHDIDIAEVSGDINVATIYSSGGTVDLVANTGSIVDGFDSEYENIRARNIVLTAASGAIGEVGNYLDINLTGGTIIAAAQGDISLNETELTMDVDHIESTQGNVNLQAHYAILDAVADQSGEVADVIGASITLISRFDTIGAVAADLEIDTGSKQGDNLTISSAQNSHVVEMIGDLYLNQVSTGSTAIAFIAAPTGRIINDNLTGYNIVSGKTYLFAAQDIGSATNALTTQVGNIQGQSTSGDTYVINTGALSVGGVVSGLPNGLLAGGRVNLVTQSPMTITENITAKVINLESTDNSVDDNITIKHNIVLTSQVGAITVNSGDGFIVESGASLNSATTITIQIDAGKTGDQDSGIGGFVDIQGKLNAQQTVTINGNQDNDEIRIAGTIQAPAVNINGYAGNDQILIDALLINGDVTVKGGSGNDTLTVNQLHTRDDALVLDGESGTDTYIVNRSGAKVDYVIDVTDSGSEADGADTLTINGTSAADTFLLRANFVAAMNSDGSGGYTRAVERVNYDRNINGRLTLNGLAGADQFFSDDTSSIATLDGGAGNDSFQIGQLFGSDRQSSLGTVALGDEIETTETTLGFLSRGNSLPMVVYGGDGEDNIKVYSNKGITKLYGEDGDDTFVVRAFIQKDSGTTTSSVDVELFAGDGADKIEYSINAPLSIDGGAGTDTVVVLGTEADDNFMITDSGIFGAGLNVSYSGVEIAEVDGLEGDDTFYILSTNEAVETTIIGGLGADTFNVASDVTQSIVSYSIEGRSSFINHSVFSDDSAYNGIFVNGVALNVASASNGAIGIDTHGDVLVDEAGLVDSYELAINVAEPTVTTVAYVTVSAARASSSDKEHSVNQAASILVSTDNVNFYESLVVTYETGLNWNNTKTIYVKAVDDVAAEGQREYVISHSVRSDNPNFDKLDINNVKVTVNDNDQADIILTSTGVVSVTEGGTSETFNVRLATRPAVGEVVTVSLGEVTPAGSVSQLILGSSTLTFNHLNWDLMQSFTVAAIDDGDVENVYRAGIELTASSRVAGSDYNHVAAANATVMVVDNDSGAIIVTQSSGNTIVTATQTDDYSLVLSKKPTADVIVNLLNDGQTLFSSSDPRFNSIDNTVTFGVNDGDWDKPIVLTLSVNLDYLDDTTGQPVQKAPLQPHTLTDIRGKLIIEGGVPVNKSRALTPAVILATETDSELPVIQINLHENLQTDTLNVFNDGSSEDDHGELTDTTLTGLGMTVGQGIEYHNIEVIETLLGTGDDNFTVANTAKGAITLIHGGGGNDTLTVTNSNRDGVLILLGDSVQDGSVYDATSLVKTDNGREFTHAGDDIIDASGAGGSVVIYGGAGNDRLTGSQFGDHIAGGSGHDQIYGLGGNDHIYGDSGFNIDSRTRLDLSTQVLTVVNIANSATDNLDTSDKLSVGNDTIDAGLGDDIVFGDKGVIKQTQGTNRILTTGNVISIANQNLVLGGSDTLTGNRGNDVLFGGAGSDSIYGGIQSNSSAIFGADNDIIFGDLGSVTLVGGKASVLFSTNITVGANDVIQGNQGDDIIIGGAGADNIQGNAGNDTVLGDNGQLNLVNDVRSELFSTDTTNVTGGNDTISLGSGDDQLIAGVGSDTVFNDSGETVIIADDGRIVSDSSGRYVLARTGSTAIGGNDTVSGGSDRDIIFGGFGNDRLDGQAGHDILGGDGSQVTRNANTIVFEAVDLFVGGNDTLIGGTGFDRMQGQFGSDLFYASFNEDVLVGEYGRFTFDANTDNSKATYIISLAQGKLDLIRQLQAGLFSGFAKQVFAESNLGQAARSRTALTTVFTNDAQVAIANLNPMYQSTGSGGSEGADFVIPTAPTAAGIPIEGDSKQVDKTNQSDKANQTDKDLQTDKTEEAAQSVTGQSQSTDGTNKKAAPEKDQATEPEQCQPEQDNSECIKEAAPTPEDTQETPPVSNDQTGINGIDLQSILERFSGWTPINNVGVLLDDSTEERLAGNRQKVA